MPKCTMARGGAVGVRRHRGGRHEEPARSSNARPFPTAPPAPAAAVTPGQVGARPRRPARSFVAALGYLLADQVQTRAQYGRAHTSLGVTQQRTRTVSAQLQELRRDLSVLKTQVGSDTTALNQDSSQLLGAQTSLSAAQAHVTQQASLITLAAEPAWSASSRR